MNQDATDLKEDIGYYKKKMDQKDNEIKRIRFNFSRATAAEREELDRLQNDYNRYHKKINNLDDQLEKKNRILKALVDHILSWRVKQRKVYDKDYYGVSLDTFWKPLSFNEKIETDYEKEKYRMNLIEEVKATIAHEKMRFTDPELFKKAAEDETKEAKNERTMLGYYNYADDQEELVFKKLIPLHEKTSNEILSVVPDKIRSTFKYI